jgi:hypothetical protein
MKVLGDESGSAPGRTGLLGHFLAYRERTGLDIMAIE